MLSLMLGLAILIGLFTGIYIGLKERYTANEGTCLLLVLEAFFIGMALVIYGLTA